jgi:hypothetical protein
MALVKLGGMIAEIRGSVGGSTFARNRGGAYVRNRSVPLNPQTTNQVAVRTLFGIFAQRFSDTLTASQRDAWEQYAANVLLPNSLGESRQVTALNHYIRSNTLLSLTNQSLVDDAPTQFTTGPTIEPTITLDATADTLSFTDLGDYTPSTDGTIGVYTSQGDPQQPGVNFYKAPFRRVTGDAIADEATDLPSSVALPKPIAAGQAVFIRTASVTPDGRVGVPVIQRFLAS